MSLALKLTKKYVPRDAAATAPAKRSDVGPFMIQIQIPRLKSWMSEIKFTRVFRSGSDIFIPDCDSRDSVILMNPLATDFQPHGRHIKETRILIFRIRVNPSMS